jgi:hypothetical protein
MRLETVQTAILAMANLWNAVNDENYAMAA